MYDSEPSASPSFRCQNPSIPKELLFDILLRLPVKSLMRFRCASKQLLALIDDPIFSKQHFNRSRKDPTSESFVIINYSHMLYSLDFHLAEHNQNFVNARKLNCPAAIGSRGKVVLLGCCNGIVCLVDQKTKNLIFWNPSTGKFKKTESSSEQWPYPGCFGYDSVRDDYKVVRMPYVSGISFMPKEIEIYSLKSFSWKKVSEGIPLGWCSNWEGVFVSGNVHWSWSGRSEESLLAFDLGTESFRLIPLPEKLSECYKLGALNQSLCLISNNYPSTSVYMMRNHGITDSWTHLFTLRTDGIVKCLISLPEWNGKVIGTSGSQVILLDGEEKKSEDFEIRGVPTTGERLGQACACFRSLVPL